jgi:hypothetical protein
VHELEILPPLETNEPAVVGRRTRDVLFPGGTQRDLSRTAVVERDPLNPSSAAIWQSLLSRASSEDSGAPGANCRIVVDEPQRVEIEAELPRAGLLVLSDLRAPGWQAVVHPTDATAGHSSAVEIVRTNRVMRGVPLPKGRHRVEFVYRPMSFYIGAAVSGLAWLTLATSFVAWLASRVYSRRCETRQLRRAIRGIRRAD